MEQHSYGLSVWFNTPDAPCPGDDYAGGPAVFTVGVSPASPSNCVEVRYRIDGSREQQVRGVLIQTDQSNHRQYFRAQLQRLPPGARVEYAPVLTNVGRMVTPPGYPAAFSVPTREPPEKPASESPAGAHPLNSQAIKLARFPFRLEFLFGITAKMRPEIIGVTPDGLRHDFFIEHGTIEGPRLQGKFRAEGGDWMKIRRDGIGIPDIRVTFELNDGTLMLMESAGTFDLGPDGYELALANQFPPTGNFMSTPRFYCSNPKYAWLVRAATFGIGLVDMRAFVVRDDVFQIVRPEPNDHVG